MEPNIVTHNNRELVSGWYHEKEIEIGANSSQKLDYEVKIAQYLTHLTTNMVHLDIRKRIPTQFLATTILIRHR